MEVEEASRRLSGVNISGTALKERQSNDGENEESLSGEDQERFNKYIQQAKKLVGEGNVEDALRYNKKALKICHKEKLAKKIKKMEEYLKANAEESSDDNNGMMHLGNGFYLYKELHDKLYAHQKAGVLWLWSLFKKKKGGILGDDMGLGKTIQVIGFLSGLFDMDKIKSVLIVLPVAVMVNWENEFNKWAPGLKVEAFHGNSKREKERALAKVQRRGGICLTTYGLVVTSWEQLGQKDGREFTWDYMILDEGHKIKNPTKTSKGVHAIPAKNRIILTGTPVQNNLKELWALFDFVHQGSLLGTQRTFKMEYDNPITRAREKDATVGEKRLGMEMAESLKRIIAPYFLRRTKAEVQDQEDKENEDPNKAVEPDPCAKMPTMMRKNDLIVWLFMSETQLKIYKDFLELDTVKELLMTKKSPLVALTVLKKICDHPRLLSTKACAQLGVDGDEGLDDELLETEAAELSAATRIQHVADDILIRESGKLVFLIKLLDQLKEEGHRCLVFSQSRKILDIMQKVLTNKGHKVMRLDGTISQVYEREQRISKFQTDNSYSVFLLTTQVGGVGLTLTAADRVVIFDPSWNPATDAQAVDRAFRIGQNKNVVIYRLITCGTVEEKIYRRQIFKDSITRQTTGNAKNPYRYFSKYELRELFTLDDPHSSTTQQQLEQMHSGHRLTDPSLDSHIAFLYSLDMFGLSDHDLMFSQGAAAGDDQDVEDSFPCPENDYIQHRVEKARQLIQMESSQEITLDQRLGKMPKPDVGYQDNRNQFEGWNIPKPFQQERKSDEIPMPVKFCPIKGYSDEIDLTKSPRQPIAMTTEDDAVDLISEGEELDIKPVIKTEKTDDYDDTQKPDVKIEHNSFEAIKTKLENETNYLSDEDVLMNTPKLTKPAVNLGNELNMSMEESDHHPLRQFDDNDMNMSLDEGNERKVTTPKVERTPKQTNTHKTPVRNNDKIVTESLFISPDSSRPIIGTAPKSFLPNNTDFASRLNSTILSNLSDTPDMDTRSKSSVSSSGSNSPGRIYKTFIEDSLAERMNQSTKDKRLIIEDSPEKRPDFEDDDKDLDQSIKMNASLLADSILEESMVQENLEQSMADENKENRHSVSKFLNRSKRHIANSGERDISSHIQGGDDGLPDLDSPILARSGIKSKSFKQRVIESSDDNSDGDNEGAISDNVYNDSDVEMEDSGNKEQDINGFINDKAEAVSDNESQGELNSENGDLEASDPSGAEYSEEESGEEEASEEEEEGNGLPEFHSLSVEDQEKYNSLVETGRTYCQQKEFEMAQACVLQALEIYPDPELQTTALKIYQKIVKYKALKEQRIV